MIADRMQAAETNSPVRPLPPGPPSLPAADGLAPECSGLAGLGRRRWLALLVCGGASLAFYLLLLGVVRELQPAEPSYAGQVFPWIPLLTREGMIKHHAAASARFLLLLMGLFGAYVVALFTVAGRRARGLPIAVFVVGALLLAVQIMQPAMLSTDVYSYVMYGRIFGLYHGDPYVKLPYHSIQDPYLPLAYELLWPSWYGPLWTLLSAGLALPGGERIGLTVLLFRGLAIAAALGAGALIWDCLRRTAPERTAQGLLFFLWNPLVVLEGAMSAHNDVVMAALLLLGIWLLLRGRTVLAVTALSLSALVKFLTGPVLPLCVLLVVRRARTWRERCRCLALGAIAAALTAAAVFGLARTSPGLPVFRAASDAFFYENNVQELLFRQLRLWLGEDPEWVGVPVHFHTSWVVTQAPMPIWLAPRPSTEVVEQVGPGIPLLVVTPDDGARLRVYNPFSGRRGYAEKFMVKAERPTSAGIDLERVEQEQDPVASATALRVNAGLRSASWAAFGGLLLVAAWRATDRRRLLAWSTTILLASYWLVATETWPWYVIWALALSALIPTSRPAVLAAILSATALSLYVSLGYEHADPSWIYLYRSLPAFALPLLLFVPVEWARGRRLWWQKRR